MLASLVVSLLLFQVEPAAEVAQPLSVPTETKGKVGKAIVVTAATDGKVVQWIPKDDGLDSIPTEFLKDKTFAASAARPGRYRVIAVTAIADAPIWRETVLVFESDSPFVPPPPLPLPIPPAPVNDLVARLQAAYTANSSAAKRDQLNSLVGLYAAMIDHANDPMTTTTKALLDDLRKVAGELIAPSGLIECRKIISAEIAACLGNDPTTTLDAATRTRAVECFRRLHDALKQVK